MIKHGLSLQGIDILPGGDTAIVALPDSAQLALLDRLANTVTTSGMTRDQQPPMAPSEREPESIHDRPSRFCRLHLLRCSGARSGDWPRQHPPRCGPRERRGNLVGITGSLEGPRDQRHLLPLAYLPVPLRRGDGRVFVM
jgi:hypothetical protein